MQLMEQNELLDRIENELRDLLELVRLKLAEQPLEALQMRPGMDSWNALECFAHLNLFLEMYLPRIERMVHLAKARQWRPVGATVRYTWKGRRVIKAANLSNTKPKKTSKKYDFIHRPLTKEVVKIFLINSERLLRNIQLVREIDINRPKVGWGPSGFFKLTLGNVLEWMVLHGQRHVLQASRAANVHH